MYIRMFYFAKPKRHNNLHSGAYLNQIIFDEIFIIHHENKCYH